MPIRHLFSIALIKIGINFNIVARIVLNSAFGLLGTNYGVLAGVASVALCIGGCLTEMM